MQNTCVQIWECLQPVYLAEKSEEDWKAIARQFFMSTNFPNCVGAIDWKHVRLRKPGNSGSLIYNYKKFCSIVLLGIVDADYCFTAVDIWAYGANSDANVFKNSNFGKRLAANQLNVPHVQPLPMP